MSQPPPPEEPAAATFTEEEIERFTVKNILDKLAGGGIPTARELVILKRHAAPEPIEPDPAPEAQEDDENPEPPPPLWAANKVALAAALGVSRQTIYDWQQLPGAPAARSNGNHSLAEWRAFADSIGSAAAAGTSTEKAALEARRLKIICDRAEFKFSVEQNHYTPNGTIGPEIRRLAAELIALLRHELETNLPKRAYRKTSAQIRALCTELLDRLMHRIHTGIDRIEQQFPAPVINPEPPPESDQSP